VTIGMHLRPICNSRTTNVRMIIYSYASWSMLTERNTAA